MLRMKNKNATQSSGTGYEITRITDFHNIQFVLMGWLDKARLSQNNNERHKINNNQMIFSPCKLMFLRRMIINLCITGGLLMQMCWITKLGHMNSSIIGVPIMVRGSQYHSVIESRDLQVTTTASYEQSPLLKSQEDFSKSTTYRLNNPNGLLFPSNPSRQDGSAAPCERVQPSEESNGASSVLFKEMLEPEPVFQATTMGAPSCDAVTPDQVSFTLVTQTSMDRLWMMQQQCQRWGSNPISIAIATKVSKRILFKILEQLGCSRDILTIQTYGDFDSHKAYPVNKLRNLAFSGVQTTHAVMIDMDFLLANNVHEILSRHKAPLAKDYRTSYVIPAFEFRSLCDAGNDECKKMHEMLVPHTKPELLDLYLSPSEEDAVAPFDSKKNVAGHGSTRYSEWMTQGEDQLLPIECVTSPRYEPYLVVRYCEDMPPFQEAYHGYGQNKLTWMQQLVRTGYSFFQLPTFLIHFPHKASEARKTWDSQREALSFSGDTEILDPAVVYASLKVNQISAKFQAWMAEHVPDRSVVLQC